MHRRYLSNSHRLANSGKAKKKIHWADELRLQNNVNRALTHYDDFYANVFNQQWPSMRLGLLSTQKYMAIPNTFTGNFEGIQAKLERLGALNIQKLWNKHHQILEEERKEIDLKKDLARLYQLEKAVEAIAANKRAEEMDILYQNAPTSKREEIKLASGPPGRTLRDVSEAAGDYIPSTKLKGVEDFTFDSEYFSSYLKKHEEWEDDDMVGGSGVDTGEIQFLKSSKNKIEFPKVLTPYSFENGSADTFPSPIMHSGLREYICVNGASILPVMALDLKPNTNLLDLCAGPGTKSLMSLLTLSVDAMTCNDINIGREKRVKQLFNEFLGTKEPSSVKFTTYDAKMYPARQEFSRVLVDVPCLNDRISCTVSDNSIFQPIRTKERLSLIISQKEILLSAFQALDRNEGSAIVYSTCTLSPVENDGVVMNALRETGVFGLHIDLAGLMKLVAPFERAGVFRIMRTRCGVLVLPNTFNNFGPMFVSRIVVGPPSTPTDESKENPQDKAANSTP